MITVNSSFFGKRDDSKALSLLRKPNENESTNSPSDSAAMDGRLCDRTAIPENIDFCVVEDGQDAALPKRKLDAVASPNVNFEVSDLRDEKRSN